MKIFILNNLIFIFTDNILLFQLKNFNFKNYIDKDISQNSILVVVFNSYILYRNLHLPHLIQN